MIQHKTILERLEEINQINLIPTNDISAYITYPQYNIIYNKMFLAELQNLPTAPWGIYPSKYPIIIKPIYNLKGMSRGFQIINSIEEYDNIENADGFFWEPYLTGINRTIDVILVQGKIKAWYSVISKPGEEGTCEYHYNELDYVLPENIIKLLEQLLEDYTGTINIEVIDGYIIEAHLRLNGDYFSYPEVFFDRLVELYKYKRWNYEIKLDDVYFFPIFVKEKPRVSYQQVLDLIKQDVKTYRKGDIYSLNQGYNWKRWLSFTVTDLDKGLKIKNKILNLLSQLK